MSTENTAETQEVTPAAAVLTEGTAPDVAGEKPQDPNIIGALTPQEMASLQRARAQQGQLITEIGNIEVRKARLLGSLSELEDRTNLTIQEAGKRLGVAEGSQFQILPDGRIRLVQPTDAQ